ncbi:uncharacterized protein Saysd1 [Prorops nasuta]|uniref:uncharacterized protein Saysd1 n=1 Tax=Prorops nasuta TaxID=863751 RepID=UPI0034CEA6F9
MQARAKLEEYRRKKYAATKAENRYRAIRNFVNLLLPVNGIEKKEEMDNIDDVKKPLVVPKNSEKDKTEILEDMDVNTNEETEKKANNSYLVYVIYLLYFLFWVTLYLIAIEFEFGAVYFIVSSLVLIYLNTRSGPKVKGELSAYSVFNPNCEAIDGTLDASQFEREIRYGIGGLH